MLNREDHQVGFSKKKVGASSFATLAGVSLVKSNDTKTKSRKTFKLFSCDGRLVEVDQDDYSTAKY